MGKMKDIYPEKYALQLAIQKLPEYRAVERLRLRKHNETSFNISYPTFWLCDICSNPISGKNLCLDHDHKTESFRGWLCRPCNLTLGRLENIGVTLFGAYLSK